MPKIRFKRECVGSVTTGQKPQEISAMNPSSQAKALQIKLAPELVAARATPGKSKSHSPGEHHHHSESDIMIDNEDSSMLHQERDSEGSEDQEMLEEESEEDLYITRHNSEPASAKTRGIHAKYSSANFSPN
jgi:hypothetical protein